MKVATIFAFGICLWANVDAAIDVKECEGEPKPDGIVKAIRVSGCDNSTCQLERKKKYKVEFDIIPPKSGKKFQISAFASFGKVEVPWVGLKTDVCKENFNIKCPIEANKLITYINEITIQQSYPLITVPVRWKITLDDKLIACFTMGAQIVAASKA